MNPAAPVTKIRLCLVNLLVFKLICFFLAPWNPHGAYLQRTSKIWGDSPKTFSRNVFLNISLYEERRTEINIPQNISILVAFYF